ncbi:ATP-binding protein [Paenibacillus sp. CCS19]|uniref:ATP-binding protein n=1 Tax=Paenibacillus sp. CCS19 TaxID=3158387 RepID=UPI00295F4FF3|nr:ATP-binding protein [Paenibacillus cellulosilyticus]
MRYWAYAGVTLAIALLTFIFKDLGLSFDPANIALIYLLPVLLSAVYWGKGVSYCAAGLGVLAFDFFFVPPFLSFSVSDLRYLISFIVFFTVAALTASLAARLKSELQYSKQKETQTASLYAISKQLSAFTDIQALLHNVTNQVSDSFHTEAAIYLPANKDDEVSVAAASSVTSLWGSGEAELVIANWAYEQGRMAGRGTSMLGETPGLYIPLRTEDEIHGVLGVNLGTVALTVDQMRFLEALGGLAASAIVRVKLSEEAKLAHLTAESERIRTAILDSVSHELRTPLAALIGSAGALIEGDSLFSAEDRMELLTTMREGALRMNRLVSNLLGIVQLESGMLKLRSKWCDIEDMIGVVRKQVEEGLQHREVHVELPDDVPLIQGDEVLLEQALTNVVSNAIKYSPDYSTITIRANVSDDRLTLTITDQGLGIAAADRERIFDKFYRSARTGHLTGTGLGLAICRGIIDLHSGTIEAQDSENEHGAKIVIRLPIHNETTVMEEEGMERA